MKIKTLILIFILAQSLLSQDIVKISKILGNIKNPEYLTDNKIGNDNFSIFNFIKAQNTSFIIEINRHIYLNSFLLFVITDTSLPKIKAEVSQDLFNWIEIPIDEISSKNKSLYSVKFNCNKKIAKFIRITFIEEKEQEIKISEITINPDLDIKVQSARLVLIKSDEYKITLKCITDIETLCIIRYGESLDNLIDGPLGIEYSKENTFTIPALLKGTEYYFVGIVKDCNGHIIYTPPLKAKTAGIPLPLIKDIKISKITPFEAEIDFNSNIETKYNIYFGYTLQNLKTAKFEKYRDKHKFILKNLKPESKIYYKIEVIDRFNNKKESEVLSFKTLPETINSFKNIKSDFIFIGENLAPILSDNFKTINRLIDQNFSYFDGSVMSGNIFSSDQTIFLELQREEKINRIDFVWWALCYSTKMELWTATNTNNWILITKNAEPDASIKYEFPVDIPYVVTRIPINKSIRFIKAIFKKDAVYRRFPQYLNLRLLEILLIPDKIYSENIIPVLKY